MTCGVYFIRNKETKECYIGASIHIEARISVHFKGFGCVRLGDDMEKFGWDNFEYGIIEACSQVRLSEREKYFIRKFSPKYNVHYTAKS